MSINYNAIVGNKEKVTMPSVEGWGTNNNILKDPPKSITTRRIDKVNQDGSINELMYESGDRFAEVLNVYARGTNPMVSVQYSNQNGDPVKQPYRIIRDGAFRPPILTQAQLLPLSRQPRNMTQVITNKQSIDYTKKVTCPAPESKRYFKEQPLTSPVIPNKYIQIGAPSKEHFVINYVNKNPLIASANTNLSAKGNTQIDNNNVTSNKEVLQYAHSANPSAKGNIQIDNNVTSNKEVLQYAHSANPSAKGNIQIDNNVTSNKEVLQYAHSSKLSGKSSQTYIHDDITLTRNVPLTSATAVKSATLNTVNTPDVDLVLSRNLPEYTVSSSKSIPHNTYISDSHNTNFNFTQKTVATTVIPNKSDNNHSQNFTRTVNLPPALSKGEYEVSRSIPMIERVTQYNSNYKTGKMSLSEKRREHMPPHLLGEN